MRFTVEDGMKMQQQHLQEWKERLSAVCYEALVKHIQEKTQSNDLIAGIDVPRGNDLTEFVANWHPRQARRVKA